MKGIGINKQREDEWDAPEPVSDLGAKDDWITARVEALMDEYKPEAEKIAEEEWEQEYE